MYVAKVIYLKFGEPASVVGLAAKINGHQLLVYGEPSGQGLLGDSALQARQQVFAMAFYQDLDIVRQRGFDDYVSQA